MNKFVRRLFMFLFLSSFYPAIIAVGQENYAIKTFTTDQGLPHNNVRGIAQDQKGFIWIATWDGLSRYDGYEFRNYYHNPGDSASLIYFQTDHVFVDNRNNVWASCDIGISKYNREKDNFKQYHRIIANGAALDRQGNFWFKSKEELFRWDGIKNQFEKVTLLLDSQTLKDDRLSSNYIKFDNKNHLWIASDGSDKMLLSRSLPINSKEIKMNFVGTFDQRKYLDPYVNNAIFNFKPFSTNDGHLWLLSNVGVFKLDPQQKRFIQVEGFIPEKHFSGEDNETIKEAKDFCELIEPFNRTEMPTITRNPVIIETYLIDRQKTVWQAYMNKGGIAGGLTRSIPISKGFKHYFFDQNKSGVLNAIFPVVKDRFGTVWAGPANLNKFFRHNNDGKTQTVVPVKDEIKKIARQPRAFLEDSAGIWIGYFSGLLLRYDFKSKQFTKELFKVTDPFDTLFPSSLLHLKKDGDEIFIFGLKSIFTYNTSNGKIRLCKLFDVPFNLYSVLRDENKGWWIGGNLGLILHYDNQFNELGRYTIGAGLFNIEEIVEGDNNDLWLSQLGGGIALLDKYTGKAEIFTTADGLSNNTCYGMLKDKRGNIWVSTNHGISQFNPKIGQFRAYGSEDGLKIDEFNSDNTYLAPDGEMFFGGMGGVVSFYPDSLTDTKENNVISPLVIEDFKVSGTPRYFSKAIYECDTVTLKKGDNNFQLTFACLDFRNAEKIKYRYRLNGEDTDFVQTDFRHRFLNYANLSPGKYNLEIEATNRDGEWVSRTSLRIVIPSYYYQTWWFRLLLVLLVVMIMAQFIYSYNHRIRTKAREKQDELRLESLRGQMNPHFIFNSLNSINYFISQNDRLSANRYIADFSRLIRAILGNMSSDYIPLAKELESLHDYLKLEHLRFGDKFDYSIHVSEVISADEMVVFPGMVQPFVENAIWHGVRSLEGRKGTVKIDFLLTGAGGLTCLVEDDGIGRKRSEKCKSNLPGKTSRGIGIVLERLKIINNLRQTNFQVKIEDLFTDREETGTKVTIDIPLKQR